MQLPLQLASCAIFLRFSSASALLSLSLVLNSTLPLARTCLRGATENLLQLHFLKILCKYLNNCSLCEMHLIFSLSVTHTHTNTHTYVYIFCIYLVHIYIIFSAMFCCLPTEAYMNNCNFNICLLRPLDS